MIAVAAAVDLSGALTVFVILVVAGAIAYIGDRVGHQVGRRRMTLFGLRPRYTSTIFAVAFGMLIALLAIIFFAVFSENARLALFSINKLNAQIVQLTQERDQLLENPVIYRSGEPLTNAVIVRATEPQQTIERDLTQLFQFVAAQARRIPYIRPYPKELTPDVRSKIRETAVAIKKLAPEPAIVIPVAGENVFRGGPMSITFEVYRDVLLYRKGEIIASIGIAQPRSRDQDRTALIALLNEIKVRATQHGMPPSIADNAATSLPSLEQFIGKLITSDGPVVVNAIAASDIHGEGPLATDFTVTRTQSPR